MSALITYCTRSKKNSCNMYFVNFGQTGSLSAITDFIRSVINPMLVEEKNNTLIVNDNLPRAHYKLRFAALK